MITTSRLILFSIIISTLQACSMAQITVRASMPMIEGGIAALYKESDLQLAEAAFPPNIELLEGMLINDPDNQRLHAYAAQAYYGYAFGFVEDSNPARASALYYRGLKHGQRALVLAGMDATTLDSTLDDFKQASNQFDEDELASIFWTASCWAKWIDLNRDKPESIAQLPKAVALMERALQLDEHYFLSGPHIFFGVYYGSRSPMLGGNFELSQAHFDKARQATNNKLLIIDLLQAQYLEVQRFDQTAFRNKLNTILQAPDNIYPEQALINNIAKYKASLYLDKEQRWF